MKIYVLSIIDLENVGYSTKDVEVYTNKEEATESMRKQYLKTCEEWGIDDPYEDDNMDHSFTSNYAFIFGEHYWDIFEKEITINQ